MHTRAHARARAHAHTYTYTYTYSLRTHTHTCAHTRTRTRARIRARRERQTDRQRKVSCREDSLAGQSEGLSHLLVDVDVDADADALLGGRAVVHHDQNHNDHAQSLHKVPEHPVVPPGRAAGAKRVRTPRHLSRRPSPPLWPAPYVSVPRDPPPSLPNSTSSSPATSCLAGHFLLLRGLRDYNRVHCYCHLDFDRKLFGGVLSSRLLIGENVFLLFYINN